MTEPMTVADMLARRRSAGRQIVRHYLCTDPDAAACLRQAELQAAAANDMRLGVAATSSELEALRAEVLDSTVVVVFRRPDPRAEDEFLAEFRTLPRDASTIDLERRIIEACFVRFELGGEPADGTCADLLQFIDQGLLDRREIASLASDLLSSTDGEMLPKSLAESAIKGQRAAM